MKKEKLKSTGDWTFEHWYPFRIIKKLFGWYRPTDWNYLAVTYDAKKEMVSVYINGQNLVSGRRKMSLKEFKKLYKSN